MINIWAILALFTEAADTKAKRANVESLGRSLGVFGESSKSRLINVFEKKEKRALYTSVSGPELSQTSATCDADGILIVGFFTSACVRWSVV